METLEERFGLSRPNFLLDPARDWECFARTDVNVHAQIENLQVDLVTGLAPKRLLWGPYGSGKTHTLYTTTHHLGNLTASHALHVECPDLGRRSTFHDLYRDGIMRSLGEDLVMELLNGALDKVGMARRDEMVTRLRDIAGDEELAKVVIQLLAPGANEILIWSWISGVPLSRAELTQLGLTQSLADAQPARLAEVIVLLGRLMRVVNEKTLVLVLDEMERSVLVGPEGSQTFVTAFTRLADQSHNDVALLIGCSAANLGDMPELFAANGPVMTRLQPPARIEIPAMSDATADEFIQKVIAYIRRDDVDVNQLVQSAAESTTEALTPALYPFTEEAIAAIKSRLRQTMTPREITLHLTQAAGKAHLLNRSCIAADVV